MSEVEKIWDVVVAVLLAVVGGLARLLSLKNKTKLKWGLIFSEIFISAFAGLMVLLLARTFGLSGDWIGLVSGMAGWVGPRVLDIVAKPAMKSIGLDVGEKEKKAVDLEK